MKRLFNVVALLNEELQPYKTSLGTMYVWSTFSFISTPKLKLLVFLSAKHFLSNHITLF